MEKLRIGIVGAGGIANGIHLPVLSRMDGAELVAVADWRPARAEDNARRYGIGGVYGSHLELLEKAEVDAVFVLTEPDLLFRAALDCLRAGKHVFMEKPMGVTLYQAQTLARTAREKGRILQLLRRRPRSRVRGSYRRGERLYQFGVWWPRLLREDTGG